MIAAPYRCEAGAGFLCLFDAGAHDLGSGDHADGMSGVNAQRAFPCLDDLDILSGGGSSPADTFAVILHVGRSVRPLTADIRRQQHVHAGFGVFRRKADFYPDFFTEISNLFYRIFHKNFSCFK